MEEEWGHVDEHSPRTDDVVRTWIEQKIDQGDEWEEFRVNL